MKKLDAICAATVLLVLVGCGKSNEYTPPAGASGEDIFSAACTQCHAPISQTVAIILSEKMANKDAVINKVRTGSMRMPAFVNINGKAADRLVKYVLSHSQTQ